MTQQPSHLGLGSTGDDCYGSGGRARGKEINHPKMELNTSPDYWPPGRGFRHGLSFLLDMVFRGVGSSRVPLPAKGTEFKGRRARKGLSGNVHAWTEKR